MEPPLSLAAIRDSTSTGVTAEPWRRGLPRGRRWQRARPLARAEGVRADRVLLCPRGGGYVGGAMYTHGKLFGRLARAAGVRGLIPHPYRRTPEHTPPAAGDDRTAACARLLEEGQGAEHVALRGDSAGGGLTIATALRARERGLPAVAAWIPFSPRSPQCSGVRPRRSVCTPACPRVPAVAPGLTAASPSRT